MNSHCCWKVSLRGAAKSMDDPRGELSSFEGPLVNKLIRGKGFSLTYPCPFDGIRESTSSSFPVFNGVLKQDCCFYVSALDSLSFYSFFLGVRCSSMRELFDCDLPVEEAPEVDAEDLNLLFKGISFDGESSLIESSSW